MDFSARSLLSSDWAEPGQQLGGDELCPNFGHWQNLTWLFYSQTSFSVQERICFAVGAVMNINTLLSTVVSTLE